MNSQLPANLHELCSVLGTYQYFPRFIPNFLQFATPLFDILSISNLSWSTNLEETFRALLRHLQTTAGSKPLSAKDHSIVISDAP
ncbi:uncharacterized protein DEA37_0013928 [Paragonimus westermani]|uniref:Reverse transcriptase/retrotransposon-derived protein RNase H-like domain-containing protein n=1 Tax=Paragonimus westermani TaxID=34504 RepID=A0A5J4NCP0_9TREM|nr:uncharacterized protein DEA37_0013928 [Paragonimus westermani]